jgi:Rrf2 family protein
MLAARVDGYGFHHAGQIMNASVGYAITALAQLATHGSESPLSCTAMCEGTGMPGRYLLTILRTLTNAGLVVSNRGVRGGYTLAKPASQITIWEVQNAVYPADVLDDRLNIFAPSSQRILNEAFSDADIQKRLSSVTIDDLKVEGRALPLRQLLS